MNSMAGIGFEGWPMAAGVEYLHRTDLVGTGTDLASVLRTWLDSEPGTATVVAPPGTDLRSMRVAWALPPAINLVTDLRGEPIRGSSLALLSPDEAMLDTAAFYLNTTSRVLVVLGTDGPTITGWLRKHGATHIKDRNALAPLNGVLAEPAVEYGLRYLLSLLVRGFASDAFGREPTKSKAISAFQAFRRGGVPLEAGPLLLEFLVSNGATINDAITLNDYARHVTDNAEIPTHVANRFRDDILQVWRDATGPASNDLITFDRVSGLGHNDPTESSQACG
jgi:hypothetical protein